VHRGGSAFAYLARAILAQQISVAAARSIAGRLTARFGRPWRLEQILGTTEPELRALGRLSRFSDERMIEALTVVKGIGRWTTEMYLMFRLAGPTSCPWTTSASRPRCGGRTACAASRGRS
jgi:DNA-3-methyladenine glycosylase II